jgi:CRP-like cAMP-binding protein
MDAILVVKEEFRRLLKARARTLGLTKGAIEVLVDHADRPIVARAGSRVGGTEDCSDYVRVLVQGAVRMECRYPEVESTTTMQFLGSGDFLCVASPEPHMRCRVSVVAHSDVTIVSVTRAHVLEAMERMPGANVGRLTSWAFVASQRVLYRKMLLLRCPLRQRIVSEFVALVPRFGRQMDGGWLIDLDLTHQDVADLVIASRANVCRAIGELTNEGSIGREGRRYWIAQRLVGISRDASDTANTGSGVSEGTRPSRKATVGGLASSPRRTS